MELNTIFVTNRNLDSSNTDNYGFGNELNGAPEDLELQFRSVVLRKDKSAPAEMGEDRSADEICSEVLENDNGKPWVFFLHGNNQTTKKNLYKAARIQDLYDVNMVVFSWPSREYNDRLFRTAISGLLKNGMSYLGVAATLGKMAKEKGKQYKSARRFADLSDGHLAKALNLLSTQLFSRLNSNTHCCFLVHSLGNLLLRNMTETQQVDLNGFKFNTCVMHQADVIAKTSSDWIKNIPVSEQKDIVVTQNNKDSVLFGARVLCALPGGISASKRMGAGIKNKYRLESVRYIDFTGEDEVKFKHGVAWKQKPGSYIHKLMMPIFTGKHF
jgi:hypothetical protein